jgi:hypothetical protein
MPRQAGLRGRLPVKPEGQRFALKWADQYLAQVPAPSYPIDVAGGITDFGMLGNDQYGDCGEAGIRHVEMTTAVAAGQPVPSFTTQEAVSEYLTYTGGQDVGVNLADFLLYLFKKGRIKAFAPVDHTNVAMADSLMQIFGGLYCGVSLTDDAEQLFNSDQEWTTAHGERPDQNEGHCIEKVRADGTANDTYVTWGALQKATDAWSKACTEEIWVVATTEEQAAAFDPQLLADIQALGGTGGQPLPVPTPPPVPDPPPQPPAPGPPPAPPASPMHPVWHRAAEAWYVAALAWQEANI